MDRYEFLRAVLPETGGNYVAFFARSQTSKWNRHCDTIEELADACVEASNNGVVAYFALATFRDNTSVDVYGKVKTRRTSATAAEFKTFAIDIDAGKADATKCYPDGETALRELVRFVQETRLPSPIIVASGHGIHAYWPLTTPIDKETWRRGGLALKALCHQHKLVIDDSKVHDASMVLRPLDTDNKGNRVRVLHAPAQLAHPSELLLGKFGTPVTKPPKALKVSQQQTLTDSILASITTTYPPADPAKIVRGCAQLHRITAAHGEAATYAQWFHALGIAKFCIAPEQTAIEWSKGHPEFVEAETLRKMAEDYTAPAPTTCAKFDLDTPGVCSKCAQWGRIGSPARLGAPDPEVLTPEVEADHTPAPHPAPEATLIDPLHSAPVVEAPPPFRRTKKGVQFDNNGVWLDICAYDLFPANIVRDPSAGHAMVEWVWQKPHVGYSRMFIKMSAIFNTSSVVDLMGALADYGFLVESKVKQGWLGEYMRAYTQLLQQHQASVELYNSFGWKEDYSKFVLGSTEFRKEGAHVVAHEVGVSQTIVSKQFHEAFEAKGDLDVWRTWTRMLDHPDMYNHQIELARGFAAPLIAFTGLNGVVFSLVGESGGGKSTAQNWCASIFGSPPRVNITAQDTQMSMVQRMGIWSCLPLGVDEATAIKPELLANLIYWGTQGQDRNRVSETTQANRWALPLSLSTNKSLIDKARTLGDVEAVLNRMLEINFPKCAFFSDSSAYGRRINLMLLDNYGLAGRIYIPHLLQLGPAQIKKDIEASMQEINDKYGFSFSGPERFWEMAAGLCNLGSRYAKELGIIEYDYTKGIGKLLTHVRMQRREMKSSKRDAYDLIAEYAAEFNGHTITVRYTEGKPRVATEFGDVPRGAVYIRREFHTLNGNHRGFLFLDRQHFHHWLVSKGFEYRATVDTLVEDQAGFHPTKNGRIYMGKDTGLALPQIAVIGIQMNHDRFCGMLDVPKFEATNVVDITKKDSTNEKAKPKA